MRISTVILAHRRFAEMRETWQRAESLGFAAAYTYDHLSWRSFRDGPWMAAIPTLAGAALVTSTIELGTLVTSPNFRHPVLLAKDLIALDDLSGGRLRIGVGAGGNGPDATVLGNTAWTNSERFARFAEFVALVDHLLSEPEVTHHGDFYSAIEAVNHPGAVQSPRPPLIIAGNGPRSMDVVARHGQGWVTYGDPQGGDPVSAVRTQLDRLDTALRDHGRPPESIERLFLHGLGDDRALDSVDAFVEMAGTYAELGFTELVIHWPIPASPFAADQTIFEAIATEGRSQLCS